MSLTNGLEYIHTTKQSIKSRLQGKGVDVSDNSPFRQYPDLIESDLKNKSWQYPSTWYQLTPKSEFLDHTVEVVVFDSGYDFGLYMDGEGQVDMTVYGSEDGGTYQINGKSYNLNQKYTLAGGGGGTFHLVRGTGVPSNSLGITTTFKIVLTFAKTLKTFHTKQVKNETCSPILALRAKDTTAYSTAVYFTFKTPYMQYCDLSLVNHLYSVQNQFRDCHNLVKCEVPFGFELPNGAFWNASNLQEVIGADFVNTHTNTYVFRNCSKYTPPSFNYTGYNSYERTAIQEVNITPPNITHYPMSFITPTSSEEGNMRNDKVVISKCRINVPDTVTTFDYRAFYDLGNEAILHLPSSSTTITNKDDYRSLISTKDTHAFICRPFLIENGENFYLDTPVGVYLSEQYGGDEVYLPHTPLGFLNASKGGNLKDITFDWDNTTFEVLSKSSSNYAIDITGQQFDHTALVKLFNNLPTVSVSKNIKITNNPGVSSLTDDEIAIVINKGYILTK